MITNWRTAVGFKYKKTEYKNERNTTMNSTNLKQIIRY